MKYFRRRRVIRRRRGRAAVKFWKKSVPRPIRKYVKAVVHRNIENKEHILYAANQSITVGDVNTMTYGVITNLGQSADVSARIGNQIKVVKGIIKVCFNILPYNATTNNQNYPYWVKVWLVRDLKLTGQLATMDSTAFGQFFRGNGVSLGFQSNCLDTTLDVNKDRFRVLYSRLFKLGTSGHVSGADNANGWFDNSSVCKQLTIPWSKHCKKQLKFDDGTGYPINENIYMVIQCIPCDGTNSAGKTPIEMHYTNTCHYEDA